jgi:hypothetical protein
MAGMTIHIALESTIHIAGIRRQRHDDLFRAAKPGETDSEARRACRSILSSSSLKSQCDLDDPILAKDRRIAFSSAAD